MPKDQRKRQKTILESLSNSPKTKKSKPSITGNARNQILKYRGQEKRVRHRVCQKSVSHFIMIHTT